MQAEQPRALAIALAGGNALGAFHAGALSALERSGRCPSAVSGASIGAINAVLFAAPRNDDRSATLRTFWETAAQDLFSFSRGQQEFSAAILSMLFGRPSLSVSYLSFPALLAGRNALQEMTPLAATLERLVDFEALASGPVRCLIGATALDPDEPCIFDSGQMALRVEHVLASAALPVLYPPVVIDGRSYVDGGVSANLPLEPLLGLQGAPLDCLALELFSLGGPVPTTLDAAIERLQSQMFAFQSERMLEKVAANGRSNRVIQTSYRPAQRESAGKTLDFSRPSIVKRWDAGEAAMARLLDRLAEPPTGEAVERV